MVLPKRVADGLKTARENAGRSIALLFVVTMPGGCDTDDAGPPSTVVADPAGIRAAVYSGPDRALSATINKAFELGGLDAGPESFYQLQRAYVSVNTYTGDIAVLNRQQHEVSVFAADGEHLFSVGREGEGPGELARPSAVGLGAEDLVTVFDYDKRALVRFSGADSLLGRQPVTIPYNGYLGMAHVSDGIVLMSQTATRGDGEVVRRLLYVSDADTIQMGPSTETSSATVFYEECGIRLALPPLFASEIVWATNGTRTAATFGAGYDVRLFDGVEVTGSLQRPLEPEAVDLNVIARELGDGERWTAGPRECLVPPSEVAEARGFAPSLPVVQSLAVTPDGGVWVRRRASGSNESEVDIFDAEARYQGTLGSFPIPFPVAFLPDGRVVTIERDDVDIERIVVYEVTVG